MKLRVTVLPPGGDVMLEAAAASGRTRTWAAVVGQVADATRAWTDGADGSRGAAS